MKQVELVVTIPVYNESANLEELVKDWLVVLTELKIDGTLHFYDDASTDNSLQLLKHLQATNNRIKVTGHTKNSGHGPVLMKAYAENLYADWIFQIDSDHDLSTETFLQMWEQRENADLLLGERNQGHQPLLRKAFTVISSNAVNWFFGRGIKDVNVPYRLIRSSYLKDAIQLIPSTCFAPNILISAIAVSKKWRLKVFQVEPLKKEQPKIKHASRRMFMGALKTFLSLIALKQRIVINVKSDTV